MSVKRHQTIHRSYAGHISAVGERDDLSDLLPL